VEAGAVARISSRPTFAALVAEGRHILAEEIERVERFFTREDLCQATAALHEMTRQPGCCP
jgi:hypothetical protein